MREHKHGGTQVHILFLPHALRGSLVRLVRIASKPPPSPYVSPNSALIHTVKGYFQTTKYCAADCRCVHYWWNNCIPPTLPWEAMSWPQPISSA